MRWATTNKRRRSKRERAEWAAAAEIVRNPAAYSTLLKMPNVEEARLRFIRTFQLHPILGERVFVPGEGWRNN